MAESDDGGLSRRLFLRRVGQAGGAAAAYHTMAALGLITAAKIKHP